MYKQKSSNKTKAGSLLNRPLLLAGLAVILIGVAIGGTLLYRHLWSNSNSPTTQPRNTVNYDPPTEDEKKATEEFKKQQEAQNSNPATPPPTAPDGRKQVTPVISYAGQYDASVEASAFIATIIEDGGTCTLTVRDGSKVVTKTSAGAADARTTRCNLFSFPAKELSAGTWTATISYDSPTATGTSDPVKFEVK